jgi:glycosyltransferase involved in cell wall biosynthesis
MKTLTVMVPFYNEARTLPELVRQLSEIDRQIIDGCIFVDDGSNDDSYQVLRQSLIDFPFNNKIIRQSNMGKAKAIEAATKELTTSHAVVLDADLELDTSEIARLWAIVTTSHFDIVFGYREFLAQSSFTYRYARGNRIISHLYGLLFNEVITDVMCGFKLLPSELWQKCEFKFSKFAMEIEIPLLMWKHHLRPFEIRVNYFPRTREQGKIIGIRDAIQIIVLLLYYRLSNRR